MSAFHEAAIKTLPDLRAGSKAHVNFFGWK